MKKIGSAVKWFFSNPTCVFFLGLAVVLLATSLEVFRGRNTNYFDYQDSTRMFWEGLSPYNMEYAQAHSIYFLYSPVFSVIFAGFEIICANHAECAFSASLIGADIFALPHRIGFAFDLLHRFRDKLHGEIRFHDFS